MLSTPFTSKYKEHFNLHFGRPQIDVCGKREGLGCKIRSPHLKCTAKKVAAAEENTSRKEK